MKEEGNAAFRILGRLLPFIGWFKGYNLSFFRLDLVSGVTVAWVYGVRRRASPRAEAARLSLCSNYVFKSLNL